MVIVPPESLASAMKAVSPYPPLLRGHQCNKLKLQRQCQLQRLLPHQRQEWSRSGKRGPLLRDALFTTQFPRGVRDLRALLLTSGFG